MKLLTKELERRFEKVDTQKIAESDAKDIPVICKYFNPQGAGTWYAVDYDPERRIFFGYAEITPGCGEFGDFSLDELENFRGRFGLGIERDLYFKPGKYSLQDVKEGRVI